MSWGWHDLAFLDSSGVRVSWSSSKFRPLVFFSMSGKLNKRTIVEYEVRNNWTRIRVQYESELVIFLPKRQHRLKQVQQHLYVNIFVNWSWFRGIWSQLTKYSSKAEQLIFRHNTDLTFNHQTARADQVNLREYIINHVSYCAIKTENGK